MRTPDAELTRIKSRIDILEAEFQSAKVDTDFCRNAMNSEWESLHELQMQYRELKEQADEEFQQASYCWDMGDKASAKEHSENGKMLNERKAYLSSGLDVAHSRFDSLRDAFEQAKERQERILAHLREARDKKNRRLDELREQNRQESAHWHEKPCAECGATISYRDDWTHIPSYCKDCKSKFIAEKQRRERLKREKPCMACGAPIVYYDDWAHIPNYCKSCKENFNRKSTGIIHKGSDQYKLRYDPQTGKNHFFFGTDKPQKGDGHGHVVVTDDGSVHYVRDQYDPNKLSDRNAAISFNDWV